MTTPMNAETTPMTSPISPEIARELKAQLRRLSRVSAYDLARTLLEMLGLTTFERAVQAIPGACAKTLRRVYSQGVPMCLFSPEEKEQAHTDTLELGVLDALAAEARVDVKQALSAHLRYGNPLERVVGVLEDIRSMVRHQCALRNPTGLFVRLMRTGEDVRLPSAVVAARQELSAPEKAAPLPLPAVGAWVRYQGDVVQVESVGARFVRLLAPVGRAYHYFVEGADTDVPLDVARRLPLVT